MARRIGYIILVNLFLPFAIGALTKFDALVLPDGSLPEENYFHPIDGGEWQADSPMICSIRLRQIVKNNVANKAEGADSFKFDPVEKSCIFGTIGGYRPFFDHAPIGGSSDPGLTIFWMLRDACYSYESDNFPDDLFFYVSTTSFNRNFTALIRNEGQAKMVGLPPFEFDFGGRADPFDFTESSKPFGYADTSDIWKYHTPLNAYTAVYNFAVDGVSGYIRYKVEPFQISSFSVFAYHFPSGGGTKNLVRLWNENTNVRSLLYSHNGADRMTSHMHGAFGGIQSHGMSFDWWLFHGFSFNAETGYAFHSDRDRLSIEVTVAPMNNPETYDHIDIMKGDGDVAGKHPVAMIKLYRKFLPLEEHKKLSYEYTTERRGGSCTGKFDGY